MNIEIPYRTTEKRTNVIDGIVTERSVLQVIKNRYNLSSYIVELHLVCPDQMTLRNLASEVSLIKKTKMLEAIGAVSRVYIHPFGVPADIVAQAVYDANRDPNTVGIIMQLPLPDYLQEIRGKIDQVKDIDSINPGNNIWTTCATSEAALKLLKIQRCEIARVGLLGARGFVGRCIDQGIKTQDLGEVIPIELGDDLRLLRSCTTLISAVGCPNLVKAEYIDVAGAYMGIDIGNIKNNGKFQGDFETKSIDGMFEYLTPVPGGMGPLEMIVLAERIVQNAVDSGFCLNFVL